MILETYVSVVSLIINIVILLFKVPKKNIHTQAKLNFGFGGLKLNTPSMYLLVNRCLFNKL